MELKLSRHLWGVDLSWEEAFPKFKAAGYFAVETGLPLAGKETPFGEMLQQNGLAWICGLQSSGTTVNEHLDSLRQQAQRAKTLGATFVSAQAGRDAFDVSEWKQFYTGSLKLEADLGIAISHETHRARPLYNPWTTMAVIEQFPTLKLTCDLSHWVCVCERLLGDSLPIIERTAEHTFHIHARVGFSEGPQVPDPRAPEYQRDVEAHETWWDLMWASQERRGFKESTLCPEFGPPGYLHTMPHTRAPLANLWDIVEWQAKRQRERFAKRKSSI